MVVSWRQQVSNLMVLVQKDASKKGVAKLIIVFSQRYNPQIFQPSVVAGTWHYNPYGPFLFSALAPFFMYWGGCGRSNNCTTGLGSIIL